MQEPITLLITNSSIFVSGRVNSPLYREMKRALGFMPHDVIYAIERAKQNPKKRKWAENWDGTISTVCYDKRHCHCPIKKDGTHFPTGLLSKAVAFFKRFNIPIRVIDQRAPVSKTMSLSLNKNEFELRDYQTPIIERSLNQERAVIKLATGGGKTSLGAAIIANLSVSPFIFFVMSTDLMHQAHDEISKFVLDNGSPLKVGMIGDGKCDIRDINIMTVQTAVRAWGMTYKKFDAEEHSLEKKTLPAKNKDIKDLMSEAKGFICDECQHWRAEICRDVSDLCQNARYRYGLSATPWRDQGDDILIEGCFGKQVCDINASYLIARNWLIAPNIYFYPIDNSSHSTHYSYQKIYRKAIVEGVRRNELIANIAIEMEKAGRLVLVLCAQVRQGNVLQQLIPGSVFLHGAHSGKERKKHLVKMRARETGITLATTIFDEGIDCRPLDTLILAGGGKSKSRALQRVGRVLRPYNPPGISNKKTDAVVIDIWDTCKYLRDHAKNRKYAYCTETEFNVEVLQNSGSFM